jgi:hypothetical protein
MSDFDGVRRGPRLGSEVGRSVVRRALVLAALACVIPLIGWLFWAFVLRLGPNDFHDYWLAGRLLLEGKSPYDTAAITALARQEHLSFSLGGGYSYPLPFALVMVPFGALPFEVAVVCFNLLSLAAFGGTVAIWLLAAHSTAGGRRLGVAALAAGLYPPVYGTVAMGQANLVLLPLMTLGVGLALADRSSGRPRSAGVGGALVGLAAIVKLVPGALLVPLALGRQWAASAGLVAGAVAAMAVSVALAPWALAGSGGLASLLDPDAFYTNQSINGFISRMGMETSRSLPLVAEFDPRGPMLAATAAFGLLTLACLWRARHALSSRHGLANGMAFALVAATIGAPKTSFWNESILLIAVGMLLALEAPDLRLRRVERVDLSLLAVWFGSALLWALIWAIEPARGGALSGAINLAWSASLYGMVALWLMLARRLLRGIKADEPDPEARPRARARPSDRRVPDDLVAEPGSHSAEGR